MKRLRHLIAARNLFLFEELKKVLSALNKAGLETILLKGALMEGVYPGGLRPFADMDLLVHREDLFRSTEIVSGLGYRPLSPQLSPGVEDFSGHVAYARDGELPIVIELHWTLGRPYPYSGRIDTQGLWKRAKGSHIEGIYSLVLCPEDSLLHACLHLFAHRWDDWLCTSCDIAELIYQYGERLDWQGFTTRVVGYGIVLPVRYALQRAYGLFKLPIPSPVLAKLGAYRPRGFERAIFNILTRSGGEGSIATNLVELLTAPGLGLKLRYVSTYLFPSKDYMRDRYPITSLELLPLFYLFRLKDALSMGLHTVFNLAIRGRGAGDRAFASGRSWEHLHDILSEEDSRGGTRSSDLLGRGHPSHSLSTVGRKTASGSGRP